MTTTRNFLNSCLLLIDQLMLTSPFAQIAPYAVILVYLLPMITWRDRFPRSMLMDQEAVDKVVQKLNSVLFDRRPFPVGQKDYAFDCDEVYPNLFLGDGSTAKNKNYLKKIGITHVVNTAMGRGNFGLVDTTEEFYQDCKIKFCGVQMMDLPGVKISLHFTSIADFIDDALASNGKVYVHCVMGISRSSTCVLAFLMIKRHMTAVDALKLVRKHRGVVPNEGFLMQLAILDIQLKEKRSLEVENSSLAELDRKELPKKKVCGLS